MVPHVYRTGDSVYLITGPDLGYVTPATIRAIRGPHGSERAFTTTAPQCVLNGIAVELDAPPLEGLVILTANSELLVPGGPEPTAEMKKLHERRVFLAGIQNRTNPDWEIHTQQLDVQDRYRDLWLAQEPARADLLRIAHERYCEAEYAMANPQGPPHASW